MSSRTSTALIAALLLVLTAVPAFASRGGASDFGTYEWTLVNGDARWEPRAGLQVVELHKRFYVMGGRTPRPPSFPPIPGDNISSGLLHLVNQCPYLLPQKVENLQSDQWRVASDLFADR